MDGINSITGLRDLISNPFILRIVSDALPQLMKDFGHSHRIQRNDVYEAFMAQWFTNNAMRLWGIDYKEKAVE